MRLISSLFVVIFLVSCKKEKPVDVEVDQLKDCLIVLCEGLFQQNNADITYVDLSNGSVSTNFFYQKANRNLGDTGNDMIRYGGKIYIAVNVSSTIEVMNAADFTPIKQISMLASAQAKKPRYLQAHGSNVYVTCYDGFVDVIDTNTLSVIQRISVGANPEGLAVANNKLYVANSGGLNFPDVDSTVSVIDLNTLTELYKITVGINPGDVEVDGNGNIFVVSRGDYASVPSKLYKINSTSDQVENSYSLSVTEIEAFGSNQLLLAYYDFGSGANSVALFDVGSDAVTNASFLDLSDVTNVYDLTYSSATGKIYLCDAMNFTTTGYVHIFSSAGTLLNSHHVGLNPTQVLVYE